MRRELQAVRVAPGHEALRLMGPLARALNGRGPAVLPLPADDPRTAEVRAAQLGDGELLESTEDDSSDPTALVVPTSGSTGSPKGVLLSRKALLASARATHDRLGGPGQWLLALPASHIAGLQVLIRCLIAGTEPVAMDTTQGFRVAQFVKATQELAGDVPRYTSLVPTQLARLLEDPEAIAALSSFDAILLGGSAIPSGLLGRANDAGVHVVTTYGMSETAGGCVYDGLPLAGAEVVVTGVSLKAGPPDADSAGSSAAESDRERPGTVWLSGPMLARGYRPQRAADNFQNGWFRTSDLGRWRNGRLEILGRADDVIITGGVNVAPAEVEQLLCTLPGIREACVVGLPDLQWGEVVAAAVVPDTAAARTGSALDLRELRATLREQASPELVPKCLILLEELPVRGPGKPDRQAVRTALLADKNSASSHQR